jgi:cyclophilin family peptidyl-prolyl cis-trans isomerase
VLTALRQAHPADVRVIFRHFPILSLHDKASLAGRAAEAAGAQGKFWEMHDLIFAGQADWAVLPLAEAEPWFLRAAGDLGLDSAQFRRDVQDTAAIELMEQAYLIGLASGIPGTPFTFFNGDLLQIDPSQQNLEAMTRLTLLNLANAGATPPPPADGKQALKALLHFNLGTLEVVLFPASAPQAVGSFVDLARRGWCDGSPVSRVIPGRIIELGDPSGTGYGDAGYRFAEEIDASLAFDRPGVVALASSGPNTNGSLFFITLDAIPELTGGRTIFGQVVSGLEVLQDLPARDPLPDLLEPSPAILERIEIVAP